MIIRVSISTPRKKRNRSQTAMMLVLIPDCLPLKCSSEINSQRGGLRDDPNSSLLASVYHWADSDLKDSLVALTSFSNLTASLGFPMVLFLFELVTVLSECSILWIKASDTNYLRLSLGWGTGAGLKKCSYVTVLFLF